MGPEATEEGEKTLYQHESEQQRSSAFHDLHRRYLLHILDRFGIREVCFMQLRGHFGNRGELTKAGVSESVAWKSSLVTRVSRSNDD